MKTFIVTNNFGYFRRKCEELNIKTNEAIMVDSPVKFYGYNVDPNKIYLDHDFHTMKNFNEIYKEIEYRKILFKHGYVVKDDSIDSDNNLL